MPQGEDKEVESGRQVDCLSDAHWPDQRLARMRDKGGMNFETSLKG